MSKLTWFGAAALAILAALPASALTYQTLPAPDGAAQFVAPDEKRPFSADSGQGQAQDFDMWKKPSSGFNFSLWGSGGGGSDNPQFIPGYSVPNRFGPGYDPQTHDPYPR